MWRALFDSIATRAKADPFFALVALILLMFTSALLLDMVLGWVYDFTNLLLVGGAAAGGAFAFRKGLRRLFK